MDMKKQMKALMIGAGLLTFLLIAINAYQSPTFPLPQFIIDFEIWHEANMRSDKVTTIFLNEELLKNMININTATAKEFEALPGIGPVTAQNIVDYRDENGDFLSINQLQEVDRIGEKTLMKIKPYLTMGPQGETVVVPQDSITEE